MQIQQEFKNIPMRFEFSLENHEDDHFHEDIELLYVFEGKVELKIDSENFVLEKDDFVIINTGKVHRFKGHEKALIGSFYISYNMLSELMTQSNMTFWCNSVIDKSSAYEDVRQTIKGFVNDFFENKGIGKIRQLGEYYELLYLLTKNFLVTRKDTHSLLNDDEDSERVTQIVNYVALNYQNKISLSELAQKLFLSEAYLSKYIKKQFGMNFLDYVNNVRLNHALSYLLYTDYSVTRIALESGFSSISTFNKVFKDKYGMSPTTYKSNLRDAGLNPEKKDEQDHQLKERIDAYIHVNPFERRQMKSSQISIVANDLQSAHIFERPWSKMINVGTASDLLNSKLQEHVTDLKQRIRFSYVRIWDLYSPEMYIDINAKNRYYNFDKLNRVLDFVVGNNLYPYLELNIKPKKLLRSVKTILIPDERNIEFDSLENVKDFMEAMILHVIDRYGIEHVERWYFELWKEEADEQRGYRADVSDNPMLYLKMFSTVSAAIKRYVPQVKIGGAGLSNRYGQKTLTEMLKLWNHEEIKPDFITFYCYPYVLGDNEEGRVNKTSTDRDYLKNYILVTKEVLKNAGFEDMPIHISEWNSTVSNRNILNDSCFKGAFILKNLIDSIDQIDTLGYWLASDIFADFYDSNELLNGSSGLISKDGIPKPAYYAFEFMNRLGKRLVQKGDYYVITDTNYKEIRIACHNFKFLNHRYFMLDEDELDLYKQEIIFEDFEAKTLRFQIPVEEAGYYEIKTHSINRQYGSVQDEWIRMACPKNLVQEDVNYLKQVCVPRISINQIHTDTKMIDFSSILEANEIQYIIIRYKYN